MNSLSPAIIDDAFTISENPYNLSNFHVPHSSNKRTVKFGIETIAYREPRMWNLLPDYLKTASSFKTFKHEIKKSKCETCSCAICKTNIQSGIYIDDRPNGIVVSYDLLSMSWSFLCYELLLYEWSHFRLVLAIVL